MVELAATIFSDGPSSNPDQPKKPLIREWGTWLEQVILAFTSGVGNILKTSRAALFADLAHAADTTAWVMGDPTVAYNGIYVKSGAAGAGSWTRVSDLPFSFIIASDVGAGTPNAIQATTSIPVSGSALIWMNVFEANTASPVTVSFNGGTVLTIKTNSGNDPVVGGLTVGMIVMGIVSGSTFRLISDQASAAIVAAAEAAADRAEAAAAMAGSGYIFPETMPSWNPSDAAQAIEDACNISAASGGQVKLTAGRTYPFSQLIITNNANMTSVDAVLRYDGLLADINDIVVAIGKNCVIDELNLSMPGTGGAGYPIVVDEGSRVDRITIGSDTQIGFEGVFVIGDNVKLGKVVTDKLDRPVNVYNDDPVTPLVGFELGVLECTSYRRAFRAYHAYDWYVGKIISKGRSPNALFVAGENSALIEGCSDWSIGLVWSEDSAEHPVRIGGSTGGGVTANWDIGRIVAIRSSGCPLKVNPAIKTTITGTVAVTSGSAALTGAGTSFTTALRVGSNIRITDTGEIYRVTAIANDTSATLDRNVTTTDAGSALEVMEAAWNGNVGSIIAIDVGEGAPTGNEELLRITHARGLTIGSAVAYVQDELVSSQYGLQINDSDQVHIGLLGGDAFNAGFVNISGASDVDVVNQFGGDVTNLTIGKLAGVCSGSNAITVNSAFRIGRISIDLDEIRGFSGNVVSWASATLIDTFSLSGRVGGTVMPAFSGVPTSDEFVIDISYNNRRTSGARPGNGRFDSLAVQQLLMGAFDPANVVPGGMFLNATEATAGQGNYGASIQLSRLGSSRRGAAIAVRQDGTNAFNTGLAFFTGGTATGTDALLEALRLTAERALLIPDGITAPSTTAGWMAMYIDIADGDLKVKFGDGTTKTIVVDT